MAVAGQSALWAHESLPMVNLPGHVQLGRTRHKEWQETEAVEPCDQSHGRRVFELQKLGGGSSQVQKSPSLSTECSPTSGQQPEFMAESWAPLWPE